LILQAASLSQKAWAKSEPLERSGGATAGAEDGALPQYSVIAKTGLLVLYSLGVHFAAMPCYYVYEFMPAVKTRHGPHKITLQ
jgi:hypothetical protein